MARPLTKNEESFLNEFGESLAKHIEINTKLTQIDRVMASRINQLQASQKDNPYSNLDFGELTKNKLQLIEEEQSYDQYLNEYWPKAIQLIKARDE